MYDINITWLWGRQTVECKIKNNIRPRDGVFLRLDHPTSPRTLNTPMTTRAPPPPKKVISRRSFGKYGNVVTSVAFRFAIRRHRVGKEVVNVISGVGGIYCHNIKSIGLSFGNNTRRIVKSALYHVHTSCERHTIV